MAGRCTAALLTLFLGASLASAEDPTDEEKRAEAHRTVLRRFSARDGAKTAELGLSEPATAFIDLYLDMQRNMLAVRNRTAPRSTMFMGNAHPQVKVEKGKLLYQAAFVNFVIDEARVPVADVPGVVSAALDAGGFSVARLPTDEESAFDSWRMGLVALCCTHADEQLLEDRALGREWKKVRAGIGEQIVAALDSASPRIAWPLIQALKRVGDGADALALIEKIEALPKDSPVYLKRMYVSGACGIDCDASRNYRGKMLASGDPALIAVALGTFSGKLSAEDRDLVVGFVSPDAAIPDLVWRSALPVLTKDGSEASVAAIRALYDGAKTEGMKIEGAFCLVRLGIDEPIQWLEAKIVEMKASTDRIRKIRASGLEKTLARARKEGEGR